MGNEKMEIQGWKRPTKSPDFKGSFKVNSSNSLRLSPRILAHTVTQATLRMHFPQEEGEYD